MNLSLARTWAPALALTCLLGGCALNPMTGPHEDSTASQGQVAHAFPAEQHGFERLASVIDQQRHVTVAVAGDSTGAMDMTWPRTWLAFLAQDHPGVRVTFRAWDNKEQRYLREVTVADGGDNNGSVDLLNGSIVGSRLDYHRQHLETLYPRNQHIDVLVINMGHNYQLQTPEQFTADIDAFMADYQALHPESAVVITSQNPQFIPRLQQDREAHAARQRALAPYAHHKDVDYLDVFDQWVTLPLEGRNYCQSDGIHPLAATGGDTSKKENGTVFWAQALREAVERARTR